MLDRIPDTKFEGLLKNHSRLFSKHLTCYQYHQTLPANFREDCQIRTFVGNPIAIIVWVL